MRKKSTLDITSVTQALEKNFAEAINRQLFSDYKPKKDRRTKWQKRKDYIVNSISEKVKSFRKWLAEKIYGQPIYEDYD